MSVEVALALLEREDRRPGPLRYAFRQERPERMLHYFHAPLPVPLESLSLQFALPELRRRTVAVLE